MESQKGIWKICKGKGDRVYINCNESKSVIHPERLCLDNGLGIYGYENLRDLAICILKYEKQKQESENIINNVDL